MKEIFIDKRTHLLQTKREQKLSWMIQANNMWKFAKPSFHGFPPPFQGITAGSKKITDNSEIVDILANFFEKHFKEPEFDKTIKITCMQ